MQNENAQFDLINVLQSIALAIQNKTAFSSCTAMLNAAQAIANGTFTPINFNAEAFDTDNFHDNATNPSRFTITNSGNYRITYNASFAIAAGGGERAYFVARNGNYAVGLDRFALTSVLPNSINNRVGSTEIPLNAGDYIQLVAYQDSGGNLNTGFETLANPGMMRLTITRID